MSLIWRKGAKWTLHPYTIESELEDGIDEIAGDLFGSGRIYLRLKKKIYRNIPDAYLIDLASGKPRLYVVEVEIAIHDLYRHIVPQVSRFSHSFHKDRWNLKTILLNALREDQAKWNVVSDYVGRHGLHTVDELLDALVRADFAALVIIDEIDEDSTGILNSFKFPVEILEVHRYRSSDGENIYEFEPFLQDVRMDIKPTKAIETTREVTISDVDTIVVPAHEDGFRDCFLAQNAWQSVRIHESMKLQIRYVAAYRTAPESAITHIGEVREIVPSEYAGKWRLEFTGPAQPIGPIHMVKDGRIQGLRGPRYTTRDRLVAAKNLDEVWASDE